LEFEEQPVILLFEEIVVSIISEAFKRIEEELKDEADVIKIRVFVEPELSEDLLTGNVEDPLAEHAAVVC